jgi:hypothetical protein
MFTHYTVIAVRRYLLRGAIALGTIIVLFGICCEGRSLLMRDRAIATRRIIAVFGIWCEGRSLLMRAGAIATRAIIALGLWK